MHLIAYWDYKQWSIWAWTPSYKWETITKEEAEARARIRIQSIRDRYKLWNLDIEYQKAIVSFVYNIWSLTPNQQWLLNNNYYCALWNNFTLFTYAWWKQLRWLVNRRWSERNLLCNN